MERASNFRKIEQLIAADPGRRGIAALVVPGDLERASAALLDAKRVAIVTGFFIPRGSNCETDGPPGALPIGAALEALGIPVAYVTDAACEKTLRSFGLEPLVADAPSFSTPESSPTHLISVERVGRAGDGGYYNMRGVDISDVTGPLDDLFLNAANRGIATIGIGDGGNEIGMGKVRGQVASSVANGAQIACIVPTDHLIVAGTSNWGAWGLVAGLSLLAGRNLLPSVEAARAQLDRLVAAGAVDGVTAQATPTVDGLDWATHAAMLEGLHSILATSRLE